MKLYRYELFVEDEPQDVGILVGVQDLGLSCEKEDALREPFDLGLAIPDLPGMRGSASFFTEEGQARFQEDILRVVAVFEDSIFDVMRCCVELPEGCRDAIVYQDADQVCIPRELYCGELASLVTREVVSLDECLGDSFRVRNVSDQIHDAEMKKDMYVLKSVERNLGER